MTTITTPSGAMLYGGDYNPEQWPEEVWARDLQLLSQAHINEVTLNVFSWAALQPSEDVYDFSRLDRIVEAVSGAGLSLVMATSTAALPAWMALRHPDVNRVDIDGRVMRHGQRHNACMSSPTYRRGAAALAGRIAERYAPLDNLVAWHISNEYGGFCWCDLCAEAFRGWLVARYGTIEAVNAAWNTNFWGHTYYSFEEIFPPSHLGDSWGSKAVLPGYSLDYRRFYGEQVRESYREEKSAIRVFDAHRPVTTNMMNVFPDYDYFTWSDDLDIVSWDSYPGPSTPGASTAMSHDLMRAIGKQRPFMLMEQTPSRVNWHKDNSLKRPGQMRQQSWQAIAHGADTIQFFQIRANRGGSEKFHGAVIGPDGTSETRTFREVAALGAELERVAPHVLGTTVEHGQVAVVFDWPSRWALELSSGPNDSLDYVAEMNRWYSELRRRGIAVDIVPATGPFEGYAAVVAPCLYLTTPATDEALRRYVDGGGRLALTPMSLLVDAHDNLHQGEAPVPLRDLAGIWVEETDVPPCGRPVELAYAAADGATRTANGGTLCDVVHADEGTQVRARYASEFYAGSPALTFRPSTHGGGVLYSATFPDEAGMRFVVDALLDGLDAGETTLPDGVELTRRVGADGTVLTFLVNTTDVCVEVTSPPTGHDLLGERDVTGSVTLEGYGVAVITSRSARTRA